MIVMMRLFFYERTASSMWTNHSKIETLVNSTWLNCLARSWHWMSCRSLAVEDIRSDLLPMKEMWSCLKCVWTLSFDYVSPFLNRYIKQHSQIRRSKPPTASNCLQRNERPSRKDWLGLLESQGWQMAADNTFIDTSTECAICLNTLDDDSSEKTITLSCGHRWHVSFFFLHSLLTCMIWIFATTRVPKIMPAC